MKADTPTVWPGVVANTPISAAVATMAPCAACERLSARSGEAGRLDIPIIRNQPQPHPLLPAALASTSALQQPSASVGAGPPQQPLADAAVAGTSQPEPVAADGPGPLQTPV